MTLFFFLKTAFSCSAVRCCAQKFTEMFNGQLFYPDECLHVPDHLLSAAFFATWFIAMLLVSTPPHPAAKFLYNSCCFGGGRCCFFLKWLHTLPTESSATLRIWMRKSSMMLSSEPSKCGVMSRRSHSIASWTARLTLWSILAVTVRQWYVQCFPGWHLLHIYAPIDAVPWTYPKINASSLNRCNTPN